MSNIEHWTIKVCPECGRLAGNFCYGPRTNEHPRAKVVEVEVVRADARKGAVDDPRLLETLARVIENRHGTLHGIGSTLREALSEYKRGR